MRVRPKRHGGRKLRQGVLIACLLGILLWPGLAAWSQAAAAPVSQWEGRTVRHIEIEGVSAARLASMAGHLAQVEGVRLTADAVRRSLRALFATGLFETIEAVASQDGDGVLLVFRGTARRFIGTVSVNGAKGATVNTQLQQASQLAPGTRYTEAKMQRALDQMRTALAQNGFNEPVISHTLTPHPEEQLVDISFTVASGPQARVGAVEVTGDAAMSVEEFRSHARLRPGSHVDHDTVNRALDGVLKHYQRADRLEAEIKLEQQTYAADTKKENYRFSATRGPVVKVRLEGASMGPERVKHVIPIFEEGTVDEDLLNEGNRRLRDYYQRLGYFDVKVDHQQQAPSASEVVIVYAVSLGPRRRVEHVTVAGNHYFDSGTLQQMLSVHAADTIDRHGSYSQGLVSADINSLQAVYQNNGFSKVKVTPETSTPETASADASLPKGNAPRETAAAAARRTAPLAVVYRIDEGPQTRVGAVGIEGAEHMKVSNLMPMLNTSPGQLLSPQNLAGDRDTLLTWYYSRGFDEAGVDVSQQAEANDPSKVDVAFHITERQQTFVRKVLLTGLHYTQPDTVARAITLHPGDPLDQTALSEMQRNFYDFALFNEVDTAIENPTGGDTYKTILLQAVEARRWALTYGFGFEAQTGTPQNNCGSEIVTGVPCSPNGKTGVSPRGILNITRNGLLGREQSASLQATYGLLEQRIDLLFQNPHFEGDRNFGLTFTGGYANSQDVTTYVASRLQAGIRWTEHFNTPGSWISKANTVVYEYNFRRVKVSQASLQVGPFDATELATAVRVAGPSVTWIRDTRDSPLDAHRGTYTSFQDFYSGVDFGAQAEFNRLDVSNSSYYSFDKGRFVLARNTRYGQERSFGAYEGGLLPLPERLFAGGPTSLRGFPVNGAGPRDPETGYPIGGAGVLANSIEIRLPPPMLPVLGNSVSLVLFEDMGNIFTNASDAWASALHTRQPDRNACKVLNTPSSATSPPAGPTSSTGPEGTCNFNYFSHTPGVGLRYHTPAGPIRLDFGYNLNPPIYPVIYDYSLHDPASNRHVGEGNHLNFFFSLGQTF